MTTIEADANHPLEEYDLVVLGSGEGSRFLAWTFARQGKLAAVIEQRFLLTGRCFCPDVPSEVETVFHFSPTMTSFRSRP